MGIVNGAAGEGILGAAERRNLEASEGGNLGEVVRITLGSGVGVGATPLGAVAGGGNSVGGSLEWGSVTLLWGPMEVDNVGPRMWIPTYQIVI